MCDDYSWQFYIRARQGGTCLGQATIDIQIRLFSWSWSYPVVVRGRMFMRMWKRKYYRIKDD